MRGRMRGANPAHGAAEHLRTRSLRGKNAGGGVTTELCYRLFAFLAQVLGSPLRGKSNSLERRIGNVVKKSKKAIFFILYILFK